MKILTISEDSGTSDLAGPFFFFGPLVAIAAAEYSEFYRKTDLFLRVNISEFIFINI